VVGNIFSQILICLVDQRTECKQRRQKMVEFIRMLERTDGLPMDFEEGLWNATVEKGAVQPDGGLVFRRKNGMGTLVTI